MSSQNLFFYYYYLKLEKAPGVIMVRCKSNTHVLLSFLIAGMKQAQRCKVPSGFRTAPFLSHPQTTKKKGRQSPSPPLGEQAGQASYLNSSYRVPHRGLGHESGGVGCQMAFGKEKLTFSPCTALCARQGSALSSSFLINNSHFGETCLHAEPAGGAQISPLVSR